MIANPDGLQYAAKYHEQTALALLNALNHHESFERD